MALDTKTKRGSAIGISLPFRQWLAEPSGTLDAGDRLSLLKLCSATAVVTLVRARVFIVPAAQRVFIVPNEE